MEKPISDVFGKHKIVSIMEIDVNDIRNSKTKRADTDGDLGAVEISEKKIVCPLGTFDVLKTANDSLGWKVKLDDPKNKILRSFILRGGNHKIDLIIDTDERQFNYVFVIDPEAKK